MLEVCSLASGSAGNCYYVGSENTSILVDAGISRKEIENRLRSIGKEMSCIRGLFITHEHSEHILGVDALAKKYDIPIHMTAGTLENSALTIGDFNIIEKDKEFAFNGLTILPFSINHDAAEPVGFLIRNGSTSASIITDVGCCCNNVRKSVSESDIVVLESNHDPFMLMEGRYSKELKQRVIGQKGHLSNYEAALLVLECAKSRLKHVMLSHLSKENNTEKIAMKTFLSIISERKDLSHLNTCVAYRDRPSQILVA